MWSTSGSALHCVRLWPLMCLSWLVLTACSSGGRLLQQAPARVGVRSALELRQAILAGKPFIHFEANVTVNEELFPGISPACWAEFGQLATASVLLDCQPSAVIYQGYEAETAVWTSEPGVFFDGRLTRRGIVLTRPLRLELMNIAQVYEDMYPYTFLFAAAQQGSVLFENVTHYTTCGTVQPDGMSPEVAAAYLSAGLQAANPQSNVIYEEGTNTFYMEEANIRLPDSTVAAFGGLSWHNVSVVCLDPSDPSQWTFADKEIGEDWIPGSDTVSVRPGDSCQQRTTLGTDYRGMVAVTRTGLPCQLWNETSPVPHARLPSRYPEYGLGESNSDAHNYCRNPDHDERGVWCYAADNATNSLASQTCNVPFCEDLSGLAVPPTESPSSPNVPRSGSGNDEAAIIGGTVAAVVALLLGLIVFFVMRSRKVGAAANGRTQSLDNTQATEATLTEVSTMGYTGTHKTHVTQQSSFMQTVLARLNLMPSGMGLTNSLQRTNTTTRSSTVSGASGAKSQPPTASGADLISSRHAWSVRTQANPHATYILSVNLASTMEPALEQGRVFSPSDVKVPLDKLENILNQMIAQQQLLLDRWVISSAVERFVGGQGIVQFVRDVSSGDKLAVKFFLQPAAFVREAALYTRPSMREMMAAVVHLEDNSSGAVRGPGGEVIPPFIVLERGQSLSDYALDRQPDFISAVQVLVQILDRLKALHALGLVHRDLKPANILWRSTEMQWTLIDFGCCAEHRSEALLAFSLPYAAPETVQALQKGQNIVTVDASLDIWSMGITIYELLVGQRVWGSGTTAKQIINALCGRGLLPWEEGSGRSEEVKELGLLKRVVLKCLARQPEARPNAAEVLDSLNRIFKTGQADSGPLP